MGSRTGAGVPACLRALVVILALASAAGSKPKGQAPPKIIQPSEPEEKFFREGERVILKCEATGTPPPMYQWYWNGGLLTSSGNMSYDSSSGDLDIKFLTKEREGFFSCRARNTLQHGLIAIAISPKIEIRVARVEPWHFSSKLNPITGTAGRYQRIECDENLPKTYGPIDYKWYTKMGERQDELILDERQFIDNNGTLHFTYLEAKDNVGNANYTCALSSATSGSIQTGRPNKLTVKPADSIDDMPPSQQAATEYVTAKRNGIATLQCVFSGYSRIGDKPEPFPKITWFYKELAAPLRNDSHFSIENNGRTLKIKRLREDDEGDYICKAKNSQGSARATLFLNVTSAPIWLRRLQDTTVLQGDDAHLRCEARSASGENPPRPPIWWKNGVRMETVDRNKYLFSNGYRQLTVRAAQKAWDIACFQCSVGNSVGEVTSQACLNVILRINITSKPKARQEVFKGKDVIVNLTVVATTDPLKDLSYRWIFDNKTYKDPNAPPLVTYDSVTKVAFINTSDFTEEQLEQIKGVYRREVYHLYEKRTVDVNVIYEPEDVQVIVPVKAGFDYWIIGLIIGILLIIIVLIIICCVICRRKMLEGDYPVDKKETAAGLEPEKEAINAGFHDLSRADYDFLPEKKSPNDINFDENIPLGDDESFGSAEYGEEATAFNEDGSFIGIYSKDKKGPGGPPGYNAESNV